MTYFDDYKPTKLKQVLFFLFDTSSNMQGSKIDIANTFIRKFVTSDYLAESASDIDLKTTCLTYSNVCQWVTPELVSVKDFKWNDIVTDGGQSNFGEACFALNEKLFSREFLQSSFYYPVIILLSDGKTSDDYMSGIEQLKKNKNFAYATKLALAIGDDANKDVLAKFTGDTEKVVPICTTKHLNKLILIFSFYMGYLYKNCSPLMIAAKYGGKEVVAQILESGANINAKSIIYTAAGNVGLTPLMAVVKDNDKELAELLINHGADVNAISSGSRGGQTVLMIASEHNSKETMELLIKHGANVNAKTKWRSYEDCTALMFASWYKSKATAELLIEKGADVNAIRNDGMTSLMFAAWQNATEIVKLLLKHGADINIADNKNRTALDIAADKKYAKESAELLFKALPK